MKRIVSDGTLILTVLCLCGVALYLIGFLVGYTMR
jgi:hypothetical protein